MPAPTNSQSDAEVLAGLIVAGKAPSGLDRDRGRVFGLRANIDDEATQFPRRPQRIEQFKVVIGQQRRRRASHQPSQHINRRGRRGLDLPCRRRTPQPQISHLQTPESTTVNAGQSSLAIASVKVRCSCRTCCAPPQTKHTVRSHLEDCPGSLRLARAVVDGEAGLGRWPSLPRRCWRRVASAVGQRSAAPGRLPHRTLLPSLSRRVRSRPRSCAAPRNPRFQRNPGRADQGSARDNGSDAPACTRSQCQRWMRRCGRGR